MRLIVFSLLFLLSIRSPSQNKSIKSETTSIVIADISNGWKVDSIGKNGFRAKVFKRLRFSKVDNTSTQTLIKYLGRPHHISKFYSGITNKSYVGYRYYVQCWTDFPKDPFYMGSYIEFVFDKDEIKFLEITDGEYCG